MPGLKQSYEAQTQKLQKASDLFQGLTQPTEAKLQYGKARQMGWLITGAEKVIKGIQAAVGLENFGPKQYADSRKAAVAVLLDMAVLNGQWDAYQAALEQWNELSLVIKQYLGLARTFVTAAGQHLTGQSSSDSEWQQIQQEARDFPANIKPAQDLAAQHKPADAIKAAKTPKDEFVKLKDRFKKAIKAEVTKNFDTLSTTNSNGPEAKLKPVISLQELGEMQLDSYNLLVLAEQEGLPAGSLTHGDALAMMCYTNEQTCNAIQAHKRDPSKTDPTEAIRLDTIAKLTEEAMAKLPPYSAALTKRGEKGWSGSDAQFTSGQPFTITSFWSTSVGTAFPGLWQITVKPKPANAKARMISGFSQYPKEEEVVFPPGTTFNVISKTVISAERIEVYVEEA